VYFEKDEITAKVGALLALKKQYKELTGEDFTLTPAATAQHSKKEQVCPKLPD